VGLLTDNRQIVLPEGGQIVTDATAAVPVPMIGHVTSSYWSSNLRRSIALALVQGGRQRFGEKVKIPLADGKVISAEITRPVFIDELGVRRSA